MYTMSNVHSKVKTGDEIDNLTVYYISIVVDNITIMDWISLSKTWMFYNICTILQLFFMFMYFHVYVIE